MSDIVKISWSDVEQLVDSICYKIHAEEFDYILGLPRGGLIPVVMMSHKLDIPLLNELKNNIDHVLVVDDIADSGDTIFKYMNQPNLRVATLYKNIKNCKTQPDYVGQQTENWIQFPWETKTVDKLSSVNYNK